MMPSVRKQETPWTWWEGSYGIQNALALHVTLRLKNRTSTLLSGFKMKLDVQQEHSRLPNAQYKCPSWRKPKSPVSWTLKKGWLPCGVPFKKEVAPKKTSGLLETHLPLRTKARCGLDLRIFWSFGHAAAPAARRTRRGPHDVTEHRGVPLDAAPKLLRLDGEDLGVLRRRGEARISDPLTCWFGGDWAVSRPPNAQIKKSKPIQTN